MTLIPLGKVARFINGAAFKPTDWEESGLPIIRIQNLTGTARKFNFTNRKVNHELLVAPGDLLVSWSATLDVFRWPGPTGVLNQHIFKVIPRPGVEQDYLFFALKNALRELSSKTHGSTMKHVVRGDFEGTQISLPPLDEQLQIVRLLDRAAKIRRRVDAARAKARAIIPALFLDTFGDPATNPKGWPMVEVGELVDRIDGGWSPTCGEGIPLYGQWGVLKLSAVKSSGFYADEAKPLPNQADPRPELEVRNGDLLFTRKNTLDLVGTAAVVNGSPHRRMLPDTVFRLVPNSPSSFRPEYLCTLINLATFRPIIRQLASGSAASMPGISKGRLLKLKIPVPSMTLQTIFAEHVQRLEVLALHLDAAAAKAEAMAAGLSAEVFGASPGRSPALSN